MCGDDFDMDDANVVCRQLGYLQARSYYKNSLELLRPDSGPIWISNLACLGDETALLDCSRRNEFSNYNCEHNEDVEVVCQGIA